MTNEIALRIVHFEELRHTSVRISYKDLFHDEVLRCACHQHTLFKALISTMDEKSLAKLESELTCPVHKQLFVEPMTLKCGHTLCRSDVEQMHQKHSDTFIICPLGCEVRLVVWIAWAGRHLFYKSYSKNKNDGTLLLSGCQRLHPYGLLTMKGTPKQLNTTPTQTTLISWLLQW